MLFIKELKKAVLSIPFIILILGLLLMVYSQEVLTFNEGDKINPPVPGQENYGTKIEEDPEVIMPAAFASLYMEFMANSYATYPIGFIKYVTLGTGEQQEIAQILASLSGKNAEDIYNESIEGNSFDTGSVSDGSFTVNSADGADSPGSVFTMTVGEDGSLSVEGNDAGQETDGEDLSGKTAQSGDVQDSGTGQPGGVQDSGASQPGGTQNIGTAQEMAVSYDEFKQLMAEAADIIGPGSSYEPDSLVSFSRVPKTYEDARKDYELIRDKDRFLGAYARLFTDYALIVLSVLPVFLGVAVALKDKHSKMAPQIYTRRISSVKLVLTRYGAIVSAVMAVALATAYISNISAAQLYPGETLDYLAPLKYTVGLIMPSVMVSAAVGMFFTELTGTPAAIIIQGLWWFMDINIGINVTANYPLWELIPRHNSLYKTDVFISRLPSLAANRICMVLTAMALMALCIAAVELKRRGRLAAYGRFGKFGKKKRESVSDNKISF